MNQFPCYLPHSVLVKLSLKRQTCNTRAHHERASGQAADCSGCSQTTTLAGPPVGILLLRLKRLLLKNASNPLTHTHTSVAVRGSDNTLVTGNKAKQYLTWLSINVARRTSVNGFCLSGIATHFTDTLTFLVQSKRKQLLSKVIYFYICKHSGSSRFSWK